MSVDKFIDRLAKTRDRKKWTLNDLGYIRVGNGIGGCPITALKDQSCISVASVARQIGLDDADAALIVAAADNRLLA